MKLFSGIVLCLLAFFFVACGDTSTASTNTTTPTPTSTPASKPTTAPTHASTQSTNPLAPVPGDTLLGQPLSHFIAKYGQPNDHSTVSGGLYHFQRYPGSNLDSLVIQTGIADGAAYVQTVEGITPQAPESGWTATTADTNCARFFPSDAVYQSQIPLPANNNYDKIYFSASLASLLPASAFTDADQNPVKPGTFDVLYIAQSQTSSNIVSCDILVGTQQTK